MRPNDSLELPVQVAVSSSRPSGVECRVCQRATRARPDVTSRAYEMRMAFAVVLLIAALPLASCSPRYAANWDELRLGLSKTEVEELLGHPRSRWPSREFREQAKDVDFGESQRWIYGKKGVFGLNATWDEAFWFATDDEAFIAVFDYEGSLAKYHRPTLP